jgi:uncharacterized membrane protein
MRRIAVGEANMDWYSLLKLVHVAFAIIWLGGGFGLVFLGVRASMAEGAAGMLSVVKDVVFLANRLFIPSSLVVVASGLAMTILGQSFATLWIDLGLVGFAATFATGLFLLKPIAERIMKGVAEGAPSAAINSQCARLLQIAKFDYVMLFVVVADMTLKPTPDNIILLGAMGLIVVAGAALFLMPRGRVAELATGRPVGSE